MSEPVARGSRSQPAAAFPPGFHFGVATSAYQTEGGLTANNWAAWERTESRGTPPVAGGDRCGWASDSWERFSEDLENMVWLGVDLYRFSVEWSRVEPSRGAFDEEALEKYRRWCLELTSVGITPMVTLHHFTEPLWVTARGGFESSEVLDDWSRFVGKVVTALGDLVHHWTTINEPVGYVTQGWIRGEWPPGRHDPAAGARVLVNLLLAHARAYRLIHEDSAGRPGPRPPCRVGLAHHVVVFRAGRPRHPLDRAVSAVLDRVYNRAVPDALASGTLRLRLPGLRHRSFLPEIVGTQDYLGLNHYYPLTVRFRLRGRAAIRGISVVRDAGAVMDDLDCPLDPLSLVRAVELMSSYGLPIIVTEHGVCDGEEPDDRRRQHLRESLTALAGVSREADVRGYIHWSLVDNFEWAYGFGARFGLFRVDPATYERSPRSGAVEYRRLIAGSRGAAWHQASEEG